MLIEGVGIKISEKPLPEDKNNNVQLIEDTAVNVKK